MPIRTLTHHGETLTIGEWAKRTNQSAQTLRYRLDAGWPIDEALYTPMQHVGRPRAAAVDANAIRNTRIRNEFDRLVHDLDRSLCRFKQRLVVYCGPDPRVVTDFQETPRDRAIPVAQETT